MSDYDISILNNNDFQITQEYGVNPDDYIPLGLPYHIGIDIVSQSGNDWNIETVNGGVVQYANWRGGGYGNVVIILQDDGVLAKYMHLESIFVSTGDYVTLGQEIGVIGNTGNSTGRHLHLELTRYDGNIWSINNHFDPIPYLNTLDDQVKARKGNQPIFHDLTINNQNNDMAILQDIKNKIQNESTPAVSTETKNAILNSFDSGDYGYGVRELNWSKNNNQILINQKKDVENKLDYTEQKLTSQEAKYSQELQELKTNVSQIKLQADKPLFNFKQESTTNRQLKTEEIQKAVLNFVKNNIATITTVLAGLGFSQSSDSIIQIVSLILGAMGYVVSYLLSLNSIKK